MTDDPTKDEMLTLAKIYLDENGYLVPVNMTLKSNLIDDLELDSLDCVGLLTYIEDTLDFSIPREEARGIKTIQDIYNCYQAYG
ncbi:phosphopantetheine-binding protein [Thiolapillus sp.]|uniref:phosphopantetheine-binding protein n=1 Tax=Thiolapillus sp. TaxID=2017437 RepID=UPI003AF934EF